MRKPSVFWGVILVALGLLFLLANTGVLEQINWDYVWPVALIALGVWLILGRVGPGGAQTSTDAAELRNEITTARLEVALGGGRIDVRSATLGDQLYKVHIEHAGNTPEIKLDRPTGSLRIRHRPDWWRGMGRLRLDAQLADAVSWQSYDIKTGAAEINLKLPKPTGAVPINISGGAMSVSLSRPAGTAVKVDARGGAVRLHADDTREDAVGSREWRSAGFESAQDRYEVSISGGALQVNVSAY